MKTVIEVEDTYWAETAFWASTPLADIPFLGGVDVARLEWKYIEKALAAAQTVGVRPPQSKTKVGVAKYKERS